MAVIISDFGMPSRCEQCDMCSNRKLDTFYCCITLKDVDIDSNKRDADCPLKELPSGKWIEKTDDWYGNTTIECSNCHKPCIAKSWYCPNCGAKMDNHISGKENV